MKHILDLVEVLSSQEILDLSKQLNIIYKRKEHEENLLHAQAFKIGHLVKFKVKEKKKQGFISKITPTKITVITSNHEKWQIPPKMLAPCKMPPSELRELAAQFFQPLISSALRRPSQTQGSGCDC